MSDYIVNRAGVRIPIGEVQAHVRAWWNTQQGKATRGRLGADIVRRWAAVGAPIVDDPYVGMRVPSILDGIDLTTDDRRMARAWGVATGRMTAQRGATPSQVIRDWHDNGRPQVEVRPIVATVFARLRTKTGTWASRDTKLPVYRGSWCDLEAPTAVRYLAGALLAADLTADDVRVSHITTATGTRYNAAYGDGGITFERRDAIDAAIDGLAGLDLSSGTDDDSVTA